MLRPACVLAAVALLASAPAALGKTVYVAAAPTGDDGHTCLAAGSPCATVQGAVGKAAANDTISLAPGTYVEAVTIPASKELTITGAGAQSGGSFINAHGSGAGAPAIATSSSLTMQNLHLEGATSSGDATSALRVTGSSHPIVTLTSATVEQASSSGTAAAIDTTGATSGSALLINGSTVTGQPADAIVVGSSGALNITHSTITTDWVTNHDAAAVRSLGEEVTATDTTLRGSIGALSSGASLTFQRDIVAASQIGIDAASTPTATADVNLRDVLVEPVAGGDLFEGVDLQGSHAVDASLTDTTVYASEDTNNATAFIDATTASTSTIRIANSILRAVSTGPGSDDSVDVNAVNAASLWTVRHTSFTRVFNAHGPQPGMGDGNVDAAPHFTDVSNSNFMLSPVSTLFDRGDPQEVNPTETDIAGAPRKADHDCDGVAQPDIGAYEAPSPCAPPPAPPAPPIVIAPPPPLPLAIVDRTKPVLSKLKLDAGSFAVAAASHHKATVHHGTKLRYTLSETAAVKVTVQLAHHHTHHKPTTYTTVGSVTYKADKKGADAHTFTGKVAGKKLKTGRYRLAIVATDAAGNRSSAHHLSFTIVHA